MDQPTGVSCKAGKAGRPDRKASGSGPRATYGHRITASVAAPPPTATLQDFVPVPTMLEFRTVALNVLAVPALAVNALPGDSLNR